MLLKRVSRALLLVVLSGGAATAQTLRPPAYPLLTHDPYFSVWSFQDELAGGPTQHWTGEPQSLEGVVRVDGQAYQFLGQSAPTLRALVPTAEETPYAARYTFSQSATGWQKTTFAAAQSWKTGPAPFTNDAARPGTPWKSHDVWVRRAVTVTGPLPKGPLTLRVWHDDDAEVYLNGTLLTRRPGANGRYEEVIVSAAAQKALHAGANVLAMHCVNPQGDAHLDAGLYERLPQPQVPLARQTAVAVTATQTTYTFAAGPVQLKVSFLSPLLLDELETLARPVSYVTCTATATDGKPHPTQLLLTCRRFSCKTMGQNAEYQEVYNSTK